MTIRSESPDIEEMLLVKCRSPRTRENYVRVVEGIGEFSLAAVRRWWAGLEAKGLSDGSLTLYRAIAQSILRYLAELGDDDARQGMRWLNKVNIPTPQVPAATKEPITIEDIEKVSMALPDDRARLALEVLRYHGLRVSTLLALAPANVTHNQRGWFLSFRTKRRRLVQLKSTEELCQKLLTVSTTPWFRWSRYEFRRMLTRAAQSAIGRHVTPHDLRRRYVTAVWEAKKDPILAMQMAGHSNIKTTQRYIVPNVEKMDEVLKTL